MKKFIILICSLLFICVVVLTYFHYYFLPDSIMSYGVGDIKIEFKNSEDVTEEIVKELEQSSFSLIDVNGEVKDFLLLDVINDIDRESIRHKIETVKRENKGKKYSINIVEDINFDKDRIYVLIDSMNKKYLSDFQEPQNAFIFYNEDTKSFEIANETQGNILLENAVDIVFDEIRKLNFKVNMLDLGCYKSADILSDDIILRKNLEIYKKYEPFVLTYLFGENKESIDISLWNNWLEPNFYEDGRLNEEIPFNLNREKVEEYVGELNKKYTTYGTTRTFITHFGDTIEISKGDYGWWLNRDKMESDIIEHFNQLKSDEKEAIFRQKAYCYGENDFSNTYIEISIENQTLWMYEDGELILESPIVTGNGGKHTRKGIYSLTYKTKNATLRGADYESFVYYWMPFDGGIGMHDATWRSHFGGNIYKTNGSHGCINMPLQNAKFVYEHINSLAPIIVW